MSDKFKNFLLTESNNFLSENIGDILAALQTLVDDSVSMGSREMSKSVDKIVGQMRKLLHSRWDDSQNKHLKIVQKVAVALVKSNEEKTEDVRSILVSAVDELQKLVHKIGDPITKIGD